MQLAAFKYLKRLKSLYLPVWKVQERFALAGIWLHPLNSARYFLERLDSSSMLRITCWNRFE